MKHREDVYCLVVIGAGPAGLMGAISAAQAGARRIVVLERMDAPGMKLRASGGGRCNLSNTLPTEAFIEGFGPRGRFVQDALRVFGRERLRAFFRERGLETVEEGALVFPATGRADDVLALLLRECAQRQIEVRCRTEVGDLLPGEGVRTSDGLIRGRAILLAGGGRGYPALGGSDRAYALARNTGHTITDLLPADVPLVTSDGWPQRLAGNSIQPVRLRIMLKGFPKAGMNGGLLFTHKGVSGPVVLNSSGRIAAALQSHDTVPLTLDLAPGAEDMEEWPLRAGNKIIVNALTAWLPGAVTRVMCEQLAIDPDMPASRLSPKQVAALTERIHKCPLTVCGTEGFDKAMVTRGGVSLRDVDPATLQSRHVPSLYFAGEVLDLDAPCGGFNLQWAFSSGYFAGQNAARLASCP